MICPALHDFCAALAIAAQVWYTVASSYCILFLKFCSSLVRGCVLCNWLALLRFCRRLKSYKGSQGVRTEVYRRPPRKKKKRADDVANVDPAMSSSPDAIHSKPGSGQSDSILLLDKLQVHFIACSDPYVQCVPLCL